MNNQSFINAQLEFLYLKKIASGLRDGILTLSIAKQSAIAFLKIRPFQSLEDALYKVQNFTLQFKEFITLKEYMDAYYKEQHKNVLVEKVRSNLQNEALNKASS